MRIYVGFAAHQQHEAQGLRPLNNGIGRVNHLVLHALLVSPLVLQLTSEDGSRIHWTSVTLQCASSTSSGVFYSSFCVLFLLSGSKSAETNPVCKEWFLRDPGLGSECLACVDSLRRSGLDANSNTS